MIISSGWGTLGLGFSLRGWEVKKVTALDKKAPVPGGQAQANLFFQSWVGAVRTGSSHSPPSCRHISLWAKGGTANIRAFCAGEWAGRSESQLRKAGWTQMPADKEQEQEEGWKWTRLLNRGLEMAGGGACVRSRADTWISARLPLEDTLMRLTAVISQTKH